MEYAADAGSAQEGREFPWPLDDERSMIVRVAKAIHYEMDKIGPKFTQMKWEELTLPSKVAMAQRAVVAITAMQYPTSAMKERGAKAHGGNMDIAHDVYCQMVDEALK